MGELDQAYRNSCATYEYRKVGPIPAGMFAVVTRHCAHCPITDATLPGTNDYLEKLCGSRRVAEYWARKKAEELHAWLDDTWVEVWPKASQPATPTNDETIPF